MNRQVPPRYCLIGNGHMAHHVAHYFDLLDVTYNRWYRHDKLAIFSDPSLTQVLKNSDHVLLLIKDDAIASFISQHPELENHQLIHFSGALHIPQAQSCHPLMTFGEQLYDLETYQQVPFVCQKGMLFDQIFPKLNNPYYHISTNNKTAYHALCVMAGNFPQMLWQAIINQLQTIDLPQTLMNPYLKQVVDNFINSPETALTGPFVRNDHQTIINHLHAMNSNELGPIYQAFVDWQNIHKTASQAIQ